jgi:hypothetical protein
MISKWINPPATWKATKPKTHMISKMKNSIRNMVSFWHSSVVPRR